MVRHEGKVAIVTGGASGIGAATARRLAADGAHVVVADIDGGRAEAVAGDIDGLGLQVDVSSPAANATMVDAARERWGRLDLAYLNAGIAPFGGVFDVEVEEFDRVIAVNLRGVFLGIKAVATAMRDAGNGGAIAVTSSVAGRRGIPATTAYAASKHGVIGLVKTNAIDLARHGIRINAVCPGTIDTPIIGPFHGDDETLVGVFGPLQAMGRVGRPEEIAAAVSFLLGDDASFMTGETLTVDGGQANMLHLSLSDAFMATAAGG